jgi:uncharacterized protein YeaO (DUF488 family)
LKDIQLKHARDPASPEDGKRILVDRLWPRGVSKEYLVLEEWMKNIAPSAELRKWFHSAPQMWEEFQQKYFTELDRQPEPVRALSKMASQGRVTLIFGAHDRQHNNAVALKNYLLRRSHRPITNHP